MHQEEQAVDRLRSIGKRNMPRETAPPALIMSLAALLCRCLFLVFAASPFVQTASMGYVCIIAGRAIHGPCQFLVSSTST